MRNWRRGLLSFASIFFNNDRSIIEKGLFGLPPGRLFFWEEEADDMNWHFIFFCDGGMIGKCEGACERAYELD